MSENQTKIEADTSSPNAVHIVVMSWFSHVLNDPFVKQWFGWLMTPVVLAFIIPLALILFIYISILILYVNRVHHRRLMRRLREAVTERDILKAGRDIVAALWDGQGWLWHGYEVVGLEKIPDVGPALLVYYHGALPLDYYYLVAKVCLLKKRVIHSVVDNFLFHIPGLSVLLSSFSGTPGTVSSCTADLQEGNLLGLSPGGVYEAMFSDQKDYKVQWKNRVGFAKIALEAQVPIIPVFTRNIREAVRTLVPHKKLVKAVYNRFRIPCAPIYGGWPVKMVTYIGDPIPYDPSKTPEQIRDECKEAIEALIAKHQKKPGSICRGLYERFTKSHTS